MFFAPALSGRSMLLGQLALGIATIVAITLAPPAQGRMMVVPLWSAGEGDAVRIALDHGARLIDRGPLARSIVVEGDRSSLLGPLLAAGIALSAAPAGGCGDGKIRR